MLQLIPPTTPDYQYSFGQAVAITYHPPPISIVLTQRQTNYIVSLYHLFRHDPTFIADRVNELWGRQGIRMSPQGVCDVLVQAQEQSGYVEGHHYTVCSNTYLETLVRHRWGLSQGVGGSGVDEKNDVVLERPKKRKSGAQWLDRHEVGRLKG
ncbi:MAG: hypothetical protein L6R35_000880 [Caloplaca aegaea]|nr:MAG: hypothetical protein L6R35_000880 [Caloplaca aegaea]